MLLNSELALHKQGTQFSPRKLSDVTGAAGAVSNCAHDSLL
jgi:hypothetical protein